MSAQNQPPSAKTQLKAALVAAAFVALPMSGCFWLISKAGQDNTMNATITVPTCKAFAEWTMKNYPELGIVNITALVREAHDTGQCTQ
jgi:hypothetical protein